MPADMNDYFKKKKPTMHKSTPGNGGNGSNGGGGNNFENPFNNMGKGMPTWLIVLAGIIFLVFTFKPYTIINSGEVGIKVTQVNFKMNLFTQAFTFLSLYFKKLFL